MFTKSGTVAKIAELKYHRELRMALVCIFSLRSMKNAQFCFYSHCFLLSLFVSSYGKILLLHGWCCSHHRHWIPVVQASWFCGLIECCFSLYQMAWRYIFVLQVHLSVCVWGEIAGNFLLWGEKSCFNIQWPLPGLLLLSGQSLGSISSLKNLWFWPRGTEQFTLCSVFLLRLPSKKPSPTHG